MLSELHLVAEKIIQRKNNQWTHQDADETIDHLQLYESCYSILLSWLDALEKDNIKWEQIHPKLSNLIGIKKQLDDTQYDIPRLRQEHSLLSFSRDFLFYIILTHLLKQSYRLFSGFCQYRDMPSLGILQPQWKLSKKQYQKLLSPHLGSFPWLSEYFNSDSSELDYLIDQTEVYYNRLPANHPLLPLLRQWRHSINRRPDKCHKEKQCIEQVRHILKSLKNLPDHYYWSEYRNLILHLLNTNDQLHFTLQDYERIHNTLKPDTPFHINDEIAYWKQAIHLYPRQQTTPMAVYQILSDFKSLETRSRNKDKDLNQYLIWAGTPYSFVRLISNLIDKKKLRLNGSSDRKPIVDYLHQFIRIEKVHKSGHTKLSSLQTYFKNVNSGEV